MMMTFIVFVGQGPARADWGWLQKAQELIHSPSDPEDNSDQYECAVEQKLVEVEKSCYHVEKKVICIPRVVFPWETAPEEKSASCDTCQAAHSTGGRTRQVKVLSKKTYLAKEKRFLWTTHPKECDACDRGNGGSCPDDDVCPCLTPTVPFPVLPGAADTPEELGMQLNPGMIDEI